MLYTRIRFVTALTCGAAAFGLLGCGGSPTAPPPAINVTGQWAGSVGDPTIGVGDLAFTLQHQGNSVSGTFAMLMSLGGRTYQGDVNGNVAGSKLTASLVGTELIFQCAVTLSITASIDDFSPMPGHDRIRGTYNGAEGCLGVVQQGEFTVFKAG